MTPLLSFFLKANIALILLYGFYFLCLRRDTFYGYIRWYLLISLISIIIFPFINISGLLLNSQVTLNISQNIPDFTSLSQNIFSQPQIESSSGFAQNIPLGLILWWTWIAIVILMLSKRLFQLACIIRLWISFPSKKYGEAVIVAVDTNIQPFSFLNYIFLNPSLYNEKELNRIITHEQVHCQQGHTVDILFTEALTCLFWFNPAVWLLRRDVKQNIEYYTDRMTIQAGFDSKDYQYSLLKVSDGAYQIANHFHFNNLKKRIIMINKKDSPRITAAKYFFIIPLLAAVFFTVQISGLQAQNKKPDSPIIILDKKAVTIEELRKIDFNNIESISVLKEENAINLYGEKAANGVILITTYKTKQENLQQRDSVDNEQFEIVKKLWDKNHDLKEVVKEFMAAAEKFGEGVSKNNQQQSTDKKERISGTVTDKDGKGLPGVAVSVKGSSSIGSVTEMNGNFTLDVPDDCTLIFRFFGMETQEIRVGNLKKVDVVLDGAR